MDNKQNGFQLQKDFILAMQTLRNSIITLIPKQQKLVTDWILKWASYLLIEKKEQPFRQIKYKQGEIVLVDFGFRVGAEFGGRHYAIVLENNNNPKSGVIYLVPITSYDPGEGESANISDVDLGVGAISSTQKGAAKVSQVGAYSKMRIEKKFDRYICKDKFNEIIDRVCGKLTKKC